MTTPEIIKIVAIGTFVTAGCYIVAMIALVIIWITRDEKNEPRNF